MKPLLLWLIGLYQRTKKLFPLTAVCRFHPTCSRYAHDAVIKYGSIKGVFLTIRRILKCHPWSVGGYDPVK